jgi:hypothetical protein
MTDARLSEQRAQEDVAGLSVMVFGAVGQDIELVKEMRPAIAASPSAGQ